MAIGGYIMQSQIVPMNTKSMYTITGTNNQLQEGGR